MGLAERFVMCPIHRSAMCALCSGAWKGAASKGKACLPGEAEIAAKVTHGLLPGAISTPFDLCIFTMI